DHEVESDVRMQRAEIAEHLRNQVAADRGARADGEAAARKAEKLQQIALGRFLLGEDSSCALAEQLAGGRRANPPRKPVAKTRAERGLELGNLPRHRGLADAKRLGRARDRPLFEDGAQDSQMVQIDGHTGTLAHPTRIAVRAARLWPCPHSVVARRSPISM